MALDPDDLLIFRERENKEKKAAKQKPAASPQPAAMEKPKEAVSQEKPKQAIPQQPAIQEKPKAAVPQEKPKQMSTSPVQAKPAPQSQNVPQSKPSIAVPIAIKQSAPQKPAPTPAKQETKHEEEVVSKKPREPIQPKAEETLSGIYASIQPSEDEIESIINNEFGMSGAGIAKKTKISRSEEQSRAEAKGQSCVWHPWRPAYAICNYCSRPFCYEDIVEYNNNYYCLEDIDKVSVGAPKETSVKYSNLSMVSASFFVLSFLLFVYFANAQVAYVSKYANSLGFFDFLARLNIAYGITIIGTILSVFNLVVGILIFARSEKWFALGLGISALDVFIFSYSYLSTTQAYQIAIAISSFLALILLLVSREAYESVPSRVPENSYLQEMSSASKF